MIKIDFEFDTQFGVFRDALHLPEDHGMTDDQIQAMKQQRLDNWIAIVTAPSPEPEPEPAPAVVDTIEIAGETYQKLEGTPPSGAKLIEVAGVWYIKV